MPPRRLVVCAAVIGLVLAACGDDEGTDASGAADGGELPTVVVTTSVLGDVVGEVVGEQAEVVTIMPVGADPHDFQPSAQEVDRIGQADALVVNGGGFEESLLDVIEAAKADGVPTFEAVAVVETIDRGEIHHDLDDEEHDGDEHADHDGATDPHFFTDPARMAVAVEGIGEFLVETLDGLDATALDESTTEYVAELTTLDADVEAALAVVAAPARVLVTNHGAFGYFADRYGFEIVGTVIPGGSTTDAASAAELAELAEIVEAEGVPAIFADTSSSDELVRTLAEEVGDVEVVELYSESLGEPGSDGATYVAMVRTNAARIAAALG